MLCCCNVWSGSSFGRCSPDMAPPPAKRQQTTHTHAGDGGGRAIPANKRRPSVQMAGSWPPPPTTGDVQEEQPLPQQPPSPTKATQTDFPDPSALAESLPMLIELHDDADRDDNDDDEAGQCHQHQTDRSTAGCDTIRIYAPYCVPNLRDVFTTQCTTVQSAVLRSHVVCPSVCL